MGLLPSPSGLVFGVRSGLLLRVLRVARSLLFRFLRLASGLLLRFLLVPGLLLRLLDVESGEGLLPLDLDVLERLLAGGGKLLRRLWFARRHGERDRPGHLVLVEGL